MFGVSGRILSRSIKSFLNCIAGVSVKQSDFYLDWIHVCMVVENNTCTHNKPYRYLNGKKVIEINLDPCRIYVGPVLIPNTKSHFS